MSDIEGPPLNSYIEEAKTEKSWRHYDHMNPIKRILYLLGFGNYHWFRKWVGKRWIHRYWVRYYGDENLYQKNRWEYHPESTFKGCVGRIEDHTSGFEYPLPQARLMRAGSQENLKKSSAKIDVLPPDDTDAHELEIQLVGVQFEMTLPHLNEERRIKFAQMYEEYLNGYKTYGDIQLFLSGYPTPPRLSR